MTVPTYPTLKTQILSLPEPEKSARRMLFSDQEWESSWELNAYPHQLPPMSDDWKYWTILGSPRTGLSTAGLRWFENLLMGVSTVSAIALLQGYNSARWHMDEFYKLLPESMSSLCAWNWNKLTVYAGPNTYLFSYLPSRQQSKGFPQFYTHVWADQPLNSEEISYEYRADQYLFTQPTKLIPNTHLSIAGKPRAL